MTCKHMNQTYSLPTKMEDGKIYQLIICTDCGQRWLNKQVKVSCCVVS